MAISRQQSNSGTAAAATSVSSTWGSTTTAANFLVALLGFRVTGGPGTITPPAGGWILLASQPINGTCYQYLYYIPNASAQSGAKSWGFVNSSYAAVIMAEYNGIATVTPLDQFAPNTGNTNTPGSASLTTVAANELLLSCNAQDSGASTPPTFSSPTNSFSQYIAQNGGTTSHWVKIDLTDRIVSSTNTYSSAESSSLTGEWTNIFASFSATSIVPNNPRRPRRRSVLYSLPLPMVGESYRRNRGQAYAPFSPVFRPSRRKKKPTQPAAQTSPDPLPRRRRHSTVFLANVQYLAASEAVTVSDSGVIGHPDTEQVTVTEPAAAVPTSSDSLTITETPAASIAATISPGDSVKVSDPAKIATTGADSVTVVYQGSHTVARPRTSDTVSVSESQTAGPQGADKVAISESVIAAQAGSEGITITEPLAIAPQAAETVTITEPATITATLSQGDAVAVTEPSTISASVAGAETVTIADVAALGLNPGDAVTITDLGAIGQSSGEVITSADGVSISESQTVTPQSGDAVSITETSSVSASVSAAEGITITEPARIGASSADSVAVSETAVTGPQGADQVTISETAALAMTGADSLLITDSVQVSLAGADSLTISEAATTAPQTSDSLTISESQILAVLDTDNDTLNISETFSITAALTAGDTVTITDAAFYTNITPPLFTHQVGQIWWAQHRRTGWTGQLRGTSWIAISRGTNWGAFAAVPVPASGGDITITIPVGYASAGRTALVHVPSGSGAMPACVLVFHGGGSNPTNIRYRTGFNAVSDANNFIVVYPAGTGVESDALSWNAGTCCAPATTDGINDVQFVRDLVAFLHGLYGIDLTRVYATGFSNGAMLCHRLGREASDIIAAIAPVSGDIALYTPVPVRAMPILYIQGGSDGYNPVAGGVGQYSPTNCIHQPFRLSDRAPGNPYGFTDAGVDQWVSWNGCNPTPSTTTLTDGTEYTYTGGGATVIAVYFPAGGHQWPGGQPDGLTNQTLITSWNASQNIWTFFSTIVL